MAFKLFVVLAIFNVVLSDPLPDPDPNIEINILQKVETSCCPGDCCGGKCGGPCVDLESGNEGKCYVSGKEPNSWGKVDSYDCNNVPNCCCYVEGCEFNGKFYPNNAVYKAACVDLVCNKGVWEKQGGIKDSCGNCTVYGDPHIYPYDKHDNIPGYVWPLGGRPYPVNDNGTFLLSQQGRLPVLSDFAVYAEFGPCNIANVVKCVYKVYYKQLDMEVEVILPQDLYKDKGAGCLNKSPDDPDCLSKVLAKVDGNDHEINDEITTLSGSSGTVLIFISSQCISSYCTITIVGSNGFTVTLEVDPYLNGKFWHNEWYILNIYAMPRLHKHLYGLCDKFTAGGVTDSFTLPSGSLITDWTDTTANEFITSWEF